VCETGTLTIAGGLTRYRKVGALITLNGIVIITNAGSGGGYIAVSIPFPSLIYAQNGCGHMFNGDFSVHGVMLTVATVPYGIAIWKYDGTTAIAAPMQYTYSMTYETTP
jgi:hypothetical protein